eukprot:1195274-Prorocentrum_minimum.AAC.2
MVGVAYRLAEQMPCPIEKAGLHLEQSVGLQRDRALAPSVRHRTLEVLARRFDVALLRLESPEPETCTTNTSVTNSKSWCRVSCGVRRAYKQSNGRGCLAPSSEPPWKDHTNGIRGEYAGLRPGSPSKMASENGDEWHKSNTRSTWTQGGSP